ncbi:LamG domain-containing protein [Actinocorallia sp. B10E7]|uniref:LamG domain-containing protein n=1 Tax=Actinocorallia sp. B10E7 TaxID=3153558 RepID=UPI00325E61AF
MLAAHWTFEEDTIRRADPLDRRALDVTGGGLPVLLDPAVDLVPATTGRALGFHGGDRAVIPAAPRLELDQLFGFGVAFFLRLGEEPTGTWRGAFYKSVGPRDARGMGCWLYPDEQRLRFQLFTVKGGAEYADTSCLPSGRWVHVAVVVDPEEIYVYLDGELDRAVRLEHPVVSPSGETFLGSDANGLGFVGEIADLRVYSTALTGEAVAALAGPDPR